ncbi:hypothetical protein OPS25_07455 [Alteromonas ponticola]|uniref:EamA domain-containing protein n=1 Tax=Alteromonas aquimaris TaxID=2998417 RepID=A0ABT3P6D5_9ALTE|nr:hypothetical protein [Alteromonas aquimaris]MCW8108328.1 hypothetical protein [Alteromonas aquimaris]
MAVYPYLTIYLANHLVCSVQLRLHSLSLFALGAIVVGAIVILTKKGTPQHKLLGYAYFATMALLNLTALFTQSLYKFGPFHWLAIASLPTVSAGIAVPLFFRHHRNWQLIHFDLML